MKSENIGRLSLTAFIFLGLQYTFYKMAQMQPDPAGGLRSVIAYQFEFLMVMTLAVGVWVPLSLWLEGRTGRPNSAWFYGIILFLLTITGFILFSYVRVSRGEKPSSVTTSGDFAQSIPETAANAVSNFAQFVDSEMELQKNDETLRIVMKFRNLSKKEITEMDYTFVALQSGRIFYRITIRDAFLVPPESTGSAVLLWERAKFSKPELYDKMRSALKANALKVYAKPVRLVFMDGSSINET